MKIGIQNLIFTCVNEKHWSILWKQYKFINYNVDIMEDYVGNEN